MAMWTEEQRRIYRREGEGYPSDLRDAEWARLEPLIPPARPGGRPRKTDMRAAMNAILYLLRTGCPWRYLPRDGFPPRSTVYNIFRKFQHEGVWEAIWAGLHMALRERMGRETSPSAAVLDSQSIKSAEKGAVTTARSAMTPASRSRAARSTPWSTAKGYRCGSSSIPPPFKTATGPVYTRRPRLSGSACGRGCPLAGDPLEFAQKFLPEFGVDPRGPAVEPGGDHPVLGGVPGSGPEPVLGIEAGVVWEALELGAGVGHQP